MHSSLIILKKWNHSQTGHAISYSLGVSEILAKEPGNRCSSILELLQRRPRQSCATGGSQHTKSHWSIAGESLECKGGCDLKPGDVSTIHFHQIIMEEFSIMQSCSIFRRFLPGVSHPFLLSLGASRAHPTPGLCQSNLHLEDPDHLDTNPSPGVAKLQPSQGSATLPVVKVYKLGKW